MDFHRIGTINGRIPSSVRLMPLSPASPRNAGSIPKELGQLQKLEALDLSGNKLTGKLGVPQIRNNKWTSSPTPSPKFRVDKTSLSPAFPRIHAGEIPKELGNLTKVSHLTIKSNQLTGKLGAPEIRKHKWTSLPTSRGLP